MNIFFKVSFFIIASLLVSILVLYYYFLPYENWQKKGSELTALTTALYWESAVKEPLIGVKAIAWTIFNRKNSKDFPDTILGVVTEGIKPQKHTGCQFSFACDKQNLMPYRLKEILPKDVKKLGFLGYQRRWLTYLFLSVWWLYINPGLDPTEGAVLYYTGPTPYWFKDMETSSIKKIGSHTFGRSIKIGLDLQKKNS